MIEQQDFWRDPIWQSVGVIVAIAFGFLALLLGIIPIVLARRRKALTYEILSITSLATITDDVGGRVQIMFDGEPARNVRLALLKVTNSGHIPIISSDYEQPVRISLNDAARILDSGVTESSPKNLEVEIERGVNDITLTPSLLNAGDSFTVKILAADFNKYVFVGGRIVGVKEIMPLNLSEARFARVLIFVGSLIALVCLSLAAIGLFIGVNIYRLTHLWLLSVGVGLALPALFIGFLQMRRARTGRGIDLEELFR